MYYGLRTYENQSDCLAALANWTNGTTTTSTTSTTTTTTPTAPVIYDVEAVSVGEDSAVIVWKTYGAGDSFVEYGNTTSYGRNSSNGSLAEHHSLQVTGLIIDTLYHFRVRSAYGNLSSVSGDYTFSTLHVYVTNNTQMTANQTTTINVPGENISMDIVTDANVSNATITVKYSTNSQLNQTLSVPGLNKYLQVETSQDVRDVITSILLKVYYTDEELNASGLSESSLAMYWYNTTTQNWDKLSTNMSWVYGTGVNISQNYVWANVSHFSNYAVGGESLTCSLKGDYSPCNAVTLAEVVGIINEWAIDKATLQEVIALITGWAATI
jgi:hypothetical protein